MSRATVLAIGTELTSGQITNRNAAWISERLVAQGFEVALHETVPDDHDLILEALDRSAKGSEILVVTGGLGPTTDDFTRDVLATWTGVELQFREASWKKIVDRLTARGVEVAETNRRQCHFPADAVVLENREGTADAYRFVRNGTQVLVLPGPPREGMHIWDAHVEPWLRTEYGSLAPEKLLIWKTLGKSEASLGEIVEAALKDSGLQTGYRATLPYVEVKVWVPQGLDPRNVDQALARLESEIGVYTVTRGNEELAEIFFEKVIEKTGTLGVTFLDLGTAGALTERILGALKSPLGRKLQERVEIMTRYHDQSDPNHLPEMASEWIFALFPNGRAVVLGPEGRWMKEITSPFKPPLTDSITTDRLRKYQTERALQFFVETLSLI